MDRDARKCCSECLVCHKAKYSTRPKETLQPYDVGELTPRSAIALDMATLPWAEDGSRCFLLIVDMFTRLIELVAMSDQRTETVIKTLKGGWLYKKFCH